MVKSQEMRLSIDKHCYSSIDYRVLHQLRPRPTIFLDSYLFPQDNFILKKILHIYPFWNTLDFSSYTQVNASQYIHANNSLKNLIHQNPIN